MLVSGGGGEVAVFHINFLLPSRVEDPSREGESATSIFSLSPGLKIFRERERAPVNLIHTNVLRQKT